MHLDELYSSTHNLRSNEEAKKKLHYIIETVVRMKQIKYQQLFGQVLFAHHFFQWIKLVARNLHYQEIHDKSAESLRATS